MKPILIAAACLALGGCFGTPTPMLIRPPAPHPWLMTPGCPWPVIEAGQRVSIDVATQAVREAKARMASCEGRLDGLQQYIRDVVRPAGVTP